jgi:hypothetical protein
LLVFVACHLEARSRDELLDLAFANSIEMGKGFVRLQTMQELVPYLGSDKRAKGEKALQAMGQELFAEAELHWLSPELPAEERVRMLREVIGGLPAIGIWSFAEALAGSLVTRLTKTPPKSSKTKQLTTCDLYIENIDDIRNFIYNERFLDERNSLTSDAIDQTVTLPDKPPRLWTPRAPGRPKPGWEEELFDFIREVYGPYIRAGFRDELRAYIFAKDRALYRAIGNFEQHGGRELPPDISMPSQRDLVRERLERAYHNGLDELTKRERRSVTGRLRRTAKPEPQ